MPRKTRAELRDQKMPEWSDEGHDNAIATLGRQLHEAWREMHGAPTRRPALSA